MKLTHLARRGGMKTSLSDFAETTVLIIEKLISYRTSHPNVQKIEVHYIDADEVVETLLSLKAWFDLENEPIIVERFMLVEGKWMICGTKA